MNTVRKKNIVITGSNRGLGLALATCFADCHWNVLCCTRDKNNRNSQSLKKFNRNIKLDVNSDEDIDHLKSFVLDTPIDVLINNAGIYTNEAFGHCSRKAMLDMYAVNAIAPLLISQRLYENLLLGEDKLIVNVTGRMGTFKSYTGPGSYGYRMSKAAANMLTKIMAEELQSQNIKVISVHPGWIKTAMGGADAPLSVTDSAQGIVNLIHHADRLNSGSLYTFKEEILEF